MIQKKGKKLNTEHIKRGKKGKCKETESRKKVILSLALLYLSGLIFFGQIEKGKVYDKDCWFMVFIFIGLLLLNL